MAGGGDGLDGTSLQIQLETGAFSLRRMMHTVAQLVLPRAREQGLALELQVPPSYLPTSNLPTSLPSYLPTSLSLYLPNGSTSYLLLLHTYPTLY